MGVEYVDVLQVRLGSRFENAPSSDRASQCHRFDYNTPIEETMQALHDVVQAGYARYIGMSSCWAYQFHAMQNYAINHKLTPFISMQVRAGVANLQSGADGTLCRTSTMRRTERCI